MGTVQLGFDVPLPAWDCNNTGGEHPAREGSPGCRVQPPFTFQGRTTKFPRILEADFARAARR